MKTLQALLVDGMYYHIFNRGNNGDNLYYKANNYRFFLQRLEEYLSPCIELFAYSLMPNHFHLLIQVKDNKEALHLKDAKLLDTSNAFHRLFTSFSKAINKQENRHGSLLENPFKRKIVDNERYFNNLIYYIHANPQLHGICEDFRHYPWSSYESIISNKPSQVNREIVLNWFDGIECFIQFHSQKQDMKKIQDLLMDD